MALLDKVLGPGDDAPFDARDALAGVILAAACADGAIHEAEAAAIADALRTKRLFAGMTPRASSRMFTRLAAILRDEGDDALLARAAEALPDELRATAFALATDLVLSDHEVHAAERALLDKLRVALRLDRDEAATIEDVLRIKNAG